MTIDYKYSELVKPLSFTEHSPAQQVKDQPQYEKAEMPTKAIYPLSPCIPLDV